LPPTPALLPYTTLFRSSPVTAGGCGFLGLRDQGIAPVAVRPEAPASSADETPLRTTSAVTPRCSRRCLNPSVVTTTTAARRWARSEEHTSELQSRFDLV